MTKENSTSFVSLPILIALSDVKVENPETDIVNKVKHS